ncbi:cation diffusion facilitator family transporter [uncultured Sphingomonas sp.]|uniref:cation diffusion facilitator family transporter n=1 Tax=uncultured Sphingomonas sp. TaxID=158754 RepID=UPI0025CFBA27|nr:cation diffusion facilitator family transporter [uncultured Sphingomonas sp.]
MSGDHDHGAHGHSHAPASFGRAFAIGTALNLGFVAVEATYGVLAGSMALLADAGHNLSDVLGLVIAWGAATLARRAPTARYTYGLRSSSILAAFLNALLLLVAIAIIAVEAIGRFSEPAPVAGNTVMVVAAAGIVVNGITAWLFASGRKGDLNIRGAFLHMAADAAVSAGVVVAGFVITRTGWSWIDPVTSLVIVAVIAVGTWGLLRDSVNMSLQAVPPGIDMAEIEAFLRERSGVADIHDLHVWPLSTTETALTVHLVVPRGTPGDHYVATIAGELHDRFGIDHATVQVESGDGAACRFEPDDVV